MKFPKPTFDELALHYDTNPESVHDCARIYRKDPEGDVYTSAMRMCEALVLANRLIQTRSDVSALTDVGGDGKGFMLGRYGYRANMCPHGLGRGSRDLAYFLQDHWGRPTLRFEGFDYEKEEKDLDPGQITPVQQVEQSLGGLIGLVGFFKIDKFPGQGHVTLWKKHQAIGKTYWRCRTILFWKLD